MVFIHYLEVIKVNNKYLFVIEPKSFKSRSFRW
jgi:hypothetical protein